MPSASSNPRRSIRAHAGLMAVGQVLLILSTLLHVGGDANDHHAIFIAYSHDDSWGVVHIGQFVGMAAFLAGLSLLGLDLRDRSLKTGDLAASLCASMAVSSLALYGALQAVDGVALKHAVDAWASAPDAEKVARFASAEALRWLEWGLRSYSDFAIGIALLSCATALWSLARTSKAVALPMALSAATYAAQGWIAGSVGFTAEQSIAIVAGWILNLIWIALLIIGIRLDTQFYCS